MSVLISPSKSLISSRWVTYVHLLEPFNLCQMPTRGDLGPNLDFHVNCNISFVLYYKIFRQDLCRFNDTTALVTVLWHQVEI